MAPQRSVWQSALATAFVLHALVGPAGAASTSPLGFWLVQDKNAVIEIYECGSNLCGRIVWMKDSNGPDGGALRDDLNPDTSLRNRPRCGLTIVEGLSPDGPGHWSGGHVYDAWSGSRYHLKLDQHDLDTLSLRGYLGVPLLGTTMHWTRAPADGPRCHP